MFQLCLGSVSAETTAQKSHLGRPMWTEKPASDQKAETVNPKPQRIPVFTTRFLNLFLKKSVT